MTSSLSFPHFPLPWVYYYLLSHLFPLAATSTFISLFPFSKSHSILVAQDGPQCHICSASFDRTPRVLKWSKLAWGSKEVLGLLLLLLLLIGWDSNDDGKWGNRSRLALNQGFLLHDFPTYSKPSSQTTSVQNFGSLNSPLNPGLLWALNETLPIGSPWWMCPEGSIGVKQAGGLAALTGYLMWNHLPVI